MQTGKINNFGQQKKSIGDIEAVIFDLDGTLTDTEKYFQMTWPVAAAYFELRLRPEMALQLRSMGRPFAPAKFQEWFGEKACYYEVRKLRTKLFEEISEAEGIYLKPGARELLSWLKENAFTVALATSGESERARNYLKRTGILPYFDQMICSDMIKVGKPAPDTYVYACHELGVQPSKALAIEDSPIGIQSAYAAGCRVIMVPDLTEPDEEILPMLEACFNSLEDIIMYLKRTNES